MKISPITDLFQVKRVIPAIATVTPRNRRRLLRYMDNYLKDCERQDRTTAFLREYNSTNR